MNILGLDLSLNGPGFCPFPHIVSSLTMTTKDGDRRYVRIRDAIEHYLCQATSWRGQTRQIRYDLAMIEAVPPYATSTASLERVHGVAREVLARYGVPFVYVSPTTLKLYAVGDGKAEKQQMIDALPPALAKTATDDEADAWWLADMGRTAGGDIVLWHTLPEHRIAALNKVAGWPPAFSPAVIHHASSTKVVQCGHGYYCLVNAGRLLHPYLLDVCDKPAKPKTRSK